MSLHMRCVSWIQHSDGSWLFIQFASLCLLIGEFRPFTFNVNIVMCQFDPAILLLAGPLVDTVSSSHHWSLPLVCFCGGWYWLFLFMFSASFRSSCKAGLVVTKSLSNCLSIKDFIYPSVTKLSLAGYEILSWKFFSLRILYWPPLSSLVGFLLRDLLWVWWVSLCGDPIFLSGYP